MSHATSRNNTTTQRSIIIAFVNAFTEGISGGDAWFIEVAKRLPEHDWIVVTSTLGRDKCISEGLHAKYIITSTETSFDTVFRTYIRRTVAAMRLVRTVTADVVLATSDAPPDVVPAILYTLIHHNKRVRYVQKIHHIIPFRRERLLAWLVQSCMLLLVTSFATLIATNSEQLRHRLRYRGIRKSRMVVTKPGVSVPISSERMISTEHDETPTSYHVIYVGRLNPTKGVLQLPTIWSEVVTAIPEARLAIVGHGTDDMLHQLRGLIKDSGLEANISLLGHLSQETLWNLRMQSLLFVSPSHEEGFGMAILEAMAVGLPTVAWNLEIYKESFDQGIVLVKENDISEFARIITVLLTNDRWRLSLGAEARQCAARFSWDATAASEDRTLFA